MKKAMCQANYSYEDHLTEGKVYDIVRFERGIFADRPFLVVIDDNGKERTAHQSRFEILTDKEK